MSSGTIAVVGGTGHIGSNLMHLLCTGGHSVRLIARPSSSLEGLSGLNFELLRGSILSREHLHSAFEGCDAVLHLAAPTRLEPDIERSIVDSTRLILESAEMAGVRRLVYTSSIATIGYSDNPNRVLTEHDDCYVDASSYHRSKLAAERLVLEFPRAHSLETVVVNPSTVIGPGDRGVTPSSQPIHTAIRRALPVWFDSGVTIAHVESVAEGHLLALERGSSGQRYILGGERLTIRDYFGLINRINGHAPPMIKLPSTALMGLGALFSLAQALGIRSVPFDLRRARSLVGKYGFYSSQKAQEQLGYRPRTAEAAIQDYVTWYKSISY